MGSRLNGFIQSVSLGERHCCSTAKRTEQKQCFVPIWSSTHEIHAHFLAFGRLWKPRRRVPTSKKFEENLKLLGRAQLHQLKSETCRLLPLLPRDEQYGGQ